MMKLKVYVTAEDIMVAQALHTMRDDDTEELDHDRPLSMTCPIACSLMRRMGDQPVRVLYRRVTIGGHRFALPPRAQRFIEDYDNGEVMAPLVFTIIEDVG